MIGAGNVATHLSIALSQAGYNIRQVFSRTEASASELAAKLKCPYTTDLSQITHEGDLYIVSVKDSALNDILPKLVQRAPQALFVHTAGSVPMNVWQGLAERYGVLYPMQTFSKERETDFDDIPIFVEANHTNDTERLQELAGRLSTKVYEATSEQRKYLHLAAVFACNFTNHLYALCDRILSEHGLPFETMLPLIRETAAKVADMPPAQAQTGPAIRYDKNVIDKQMALLSDPIMRQIYDLMSRSIHETNKH